MAHVSAFFLLGTLGKSAWGGGLPGRRPAASPLGRRPSRPPTRRARRPPPPAAARLRARPAHTQSNATPDAGDEMARNGRRQEGGPLPACSPRRSRRGAAAPPPPNKKKRHPKFHECERVRYPKGPTPSDAQNKHEDKKRTKVSPPKVKSKVIIKCIFHLPSHGCFPYTTSDFEVAVHKKKVKEAKSGSSKVCPVVLDSAASFFVVNLPKCCLEARDWTFLARDFSVIKKEIHLT